MLAKEWKWQRLKSVNALPISSSLCLYSHNAPLMISALRISLGRKNYNQYSFAYEFYTFPAVQWYFPFSTILQESVKWLVMPSVPDSLFLSHRKEVWLSSFFWQKELNKLWFLIFDFFPFLKLKKVKELQFFQNKRNVAKNFYQYIFLCTTFTLKDYRLQKKITQQIHLANTFEARQFSNI